MSRFRYIECPYELYFRYFIFLAIDETCKIITSMGGFCKGYVVDISKKEEVYKMAEEIRNRIGDVTLLFNNAGVVSGRMLLDTPDHLIERSFNVNVIAHFWVNINFFFCHINKYNEW